MDREKSISELFVNFILAQVIDSLFYSYSKQEPSKESLLEKALYPSIYRSPSELSNFLLKNVLFHRPSDILAVNKPYGISSVGYKQENAGVFKSERYTKKEFADFAENEEDLAKPSGSEVTLEHSLEYLSQRFDEQELNFCTGLKRYVTGPVVLPCNPKAAKRLVESIKFANMLANNKVDEDFEEFSMHKALTICVGKPLSSSGTITGYATFQSVNDRQSSQRNEYIFVMDKKVKARQKSGQYAVPGIVHYNVLATKNGASLVDLRFSKFARHIPRLALTYLNSPILGDAIYQQRIIEISGRPELVEPKEISRIPGKRQYAPPDLLELLELKYPSDLNNIPMFFHVYQTIFPRYGGGGVKRKGSPDLIIRAPLSSHFAAMAKLLGFRKALIKHLNELDNEEEKVKYETNTSKEIYF